MKRQSPRSGAGRDEKRSTVSSSSSSGRGSMEKIRVPIERGKNPKAIEVSGS